MVDSDTWIATVAWHIGYDSDLGLHKINVKRFWDDNEARNYYNKVSSDYAKKLYSKNLGELVYSEEWAKWIPNPLTGVSQRPDWVSYYDRPDYDEDFTTQFVKYYDSDDYAEEFYYRCKADAKKLTINRKKISEKGKIAPYLI